MKNEKPWVAYSCCAGMDEFDTQEEAEAWVLEHEQDDECCPDACSGSCFVARLASRTEFVVAEEDYGLDDQRGYLQFVPVSVVKDSFTADASKMVPQKDQPLFPCSECGFMRTEAEGGKIFTVCEQCYDKKNVSK